MKTEDADGLDAYDRSLMRKTLQLVLAAAQAAFLPVNHDENACEWGCNGPKRAQSIDLREFTKNMENLIESLT